MRPKVRQTNRIQISTKYLLCVLQRLFEENIQQYGRIIDFQFWLLTLWLDWLIVQCSSLLNLPKQLVISENSALWFWFLNISTLTRNETVFFNMKGRTEGENAKEMKVLDWVADDRILLGGCRHETSKFERIRWKICWNYVLAYLCVLAIGGFWLTKK